MARLSDTELVILTAASGRPDGTVYPITSKLAGGALHKVLAGLLAKGLVAEVRATTDQTVWRRDEDGRPLTLAVTAAAAEAIGLGSDARPTGATEAPDGAGKAASGGTGKADRTSRRVGREGKATGAGSGTRASRAAHAGKENTPGQTAVRGTKARHAPAQGDSGARPDRKSRTDTKQAQLIAMLRARDGATVEEIATAFGWQTHTVRGAIYGALRKKLGLDITSDKVDGRGRVYRITG